ncbi:hypothetical protein AAVH_42620 [Aphelenchoides avenae]|nr:hypothetical protein AAVH_42620 [Aphelenchus avenae]
MTGNQGSGMDRRNQDAYEARATRIQQHLFDLQDEYEELAARRPCILDFTQYNTEQLNQLDAQLRAATDHIRSCTTDYNRAVSDWEAVIREHGLREDASTWAQNQLRHHAAYFADPAIAPSLYFKFCELRLSYQDTRYNLEQFRQQTTTQANLTSRPPLGSLPEDASTSSATLADRPTLGSLPETRLATAS